MKYLLTTALMFLLFVHSNKIFSQTPEEILQKNGIVLPKFQKPIATYVNCVRVGNLLYLSGKGPLKADRGDSADRN